MRIPIVSGILADNSAEIWLPIAGYEGSYSVSSFGRVRSDPRYVRHSGGGLALKKSGIRALFPDKDGYEKVVLSKGGKNSIFYVHSLVLSAFVGPRPSGFVSCHNNGNRADNRPTNLRWDTIEGNFSDKVIHGTHMRGERSNRSKVTDEQRRAIVKDGRKPRFIARDYGIAPNTVWAIRRNPLWRSA